MKFILILFSAMFLLKSCNQNSAKADIQSEETTTETVNDVFTDKWGDSYLLGKVSDSILFEEPYNKWFSDREDYEVNTEAIEQLKGTLNNYDLEVFFGSWCSDSQTHLPSLFAILDAVDYDLQQLEMVAVGDEGKWYKESPGGEHKGKDINYIPTIIVKENGKEVNRIVESPIETVEQDLLAIISGEEYEHQYADEE